MYHVSHPHSAGGAFSVALYDSNYNSAQYPDTVTFYDCKFIGNSAFREGTAVGLFSVIRVDQIGFPVYFVDWYVQCHVLMQLIE